MTHNLQDVSTTTSPKVGERFQDALVFAARTHRTQVRKNTGDVPYIAHLLAVSSLVLEAGGDEDLAIAALLHDAAEDQGGEEMLAQIGARFGDRVRRIVAGCSDTFVQPKPPWCERKRAYISHVREVADADVCIVSAADKIHNARAILTDHYEMGDEVFDRFKASKEQTLWYYRELVAAFDDALNRVRAADRSGDLRRLVNELRRVVIALMERAASGLSIGAGGDPCPE